MIAEMSSGMQISEARRLNLLKNTKKDRKAHKMQEKNIEKAFLCPWSRLTGQTRERSHGARGTSDVPRYGREDFRGAQRSRNITRPPDSFDFLFPKAPAKGFV